jgi:hypothetical protein
MDGGEVFAMRSYTLDEVCVVLELRADAAA